MLDKLAAKMTVTQAEIMDKTTRTVIDEDGVETIEIVAWAGGVVLAITGLIVIYKAFLQKSFAPLGG